jgi:hypothetical protein
VVAEDAVVMHSRGADLGILACAEPGVDRRNLRKVVQPLQDRAHRVFEREVNDLVTGENSGEVWTNVIEIRIAVVIHPEKTALEQVLSQSGSLLIREFVIRRVLHAHDGTMKRGSGPSP